MTTVLTPKLERDGNWWWGGEPEDRWLCHAELSRLFDLRDAEAIQAECSDAPLKGGYVFWFRRTSTGPLWRRRVWWGTTKTSVMGDGELFINAAEDVLRRAFPLTTTPTKLYVRLWLLTGCDAEGE